MSLMAIDVVLLLPDAIEASAKAANAALCAQREDGFRFDATHRPHVSLVQQFVRREHLPAVGEQLSPILRGTPPLSLQVLGVGSHEPVVYFLLERTPELVKLHESCMKVLEPLAELPGTAGAFFTEGEPVREADVAYVGEYRSRAAYGNFVPHITLGLGPMPEFHEPFYFTGERVCLFQLGRFCTCRKLLREWTLPAGPGDESVGIENT